MRGGDWVEEEEGMAALAISMGYPTAACATEHLARTQSYCRPPTAQQVLFAVALLQSAFPLASVPQP